MWRASFPAHPPKSRLKKALDPDANYTEDKGDFEIPTDVPDEDDSADEPDTEPI